MEKFTPDIRERGQDFVGRCFDDCPAENPMWYSPDRTNLDSPARDSAGLGFCVGCGEVYEVTPQRDNVFLLYHEKEFGPYHPVEALEKLNQLEEQARESGNASQ